MVTATLDAPKAKNSAAATLAPRNPLSKLPIYSWQAHPKHRARRWVTVVLPFDQACLVFAPQEYDYTKGTGQQRPEINAWINQLRKRIEDDKYAPTIWSACLRQSQVKRSEWHEDGTVTINIGTMTIPLIDGNHRRNALQRMLDAAEKKGDQEMAARINALPILVQIYLEPERAQKNFIALQEGKKVSPDLISMMLQREDETPEQKIAFNTALRLMVDQRSHLSGKIGTGVGNPGSNMLGIKTATTSNASELACSLRGGGNIAVNFGKDEAWLQECFVEAWDAVRNHTVQEEFMGTGQTMASVLMPGKVLCPLGFHRGGKGGTTLINGIANMWAYMKAIKGLDKMTEAERDHLVACVDDVFDFPNPTGLSAPQKRLLMRKFVVAYFKNVVLSEGERAKAGRVPHVNGIPRALFNDLMMPSSFGPANAVAMLTEDEGGLADYNSGGLGDVDDGDPKIHEA